METHDAAVGVGLHQGRGVVGRAVRDHDDLEIGVVEGQAVLELFLDEGRLVVGGHDQAHPGRDVPLDDGAWPQA
jgi:hypothetical protein